MFLSPLDLHSPYFGKKTLDITAVTSRRRFNSYQVIYKFGINEASLLRQSDMVDGLLFFPSGFLLSRAVVGLTTTEVISSLFLRTTRRLSPTPGTHFLRPRGLTPTLGWDHFFAVQ